MELFGSTDLPVIGETPYFLTLGPHSFFWFSLQPRVTASLSSGSRAPAAAVVPEIKITGDWDTVLLGSARERLESVLLGFVRQRRWFAGKARRLKSAQIVDAIHLPGADDSAYMATVLVSYAEGDPDTYLVPMAYASAVEAPQILERWPNSAIAWLRSSGEEQRGLLYDALGPPGFADALLNAIARRRRSTGDTGTLVGSTTKRLCDCAGRDDHSRRLCRWRSRATTLVVYGERLILKCRAAWRRA